MAFPRKLLHETEDLVLDLKPHWWFLAEPAAALLGSIILGIVVLTQLNGDATWEDVARIGAVVLIVLCVLWFAVRYMKWYTTNFVVTTDRLVYRAGVIAKRGIEIPLERVNTVFFNQTIFERMLGAGDLSIESGGETGKQTFSDIRKPSEVQNEIYRQMEANNTRMYGGGRVAAPPPEASLAEQLEQLDGLRQRGILTQAEFDAKKADLLKRM